MSTLSDRGSRIISQREPSEYKLVREIVALSVADNWDAAKREWALASIWFSDDPSTCLCGHRPIFEHCEIVNVVNGNTAIVGNVCVTRFLGLPSDKLFQAIQRIAADRGRALNAEAIAYAHEKGWLNNWEREFYLDTMRKRKLSTKQRAKREQVNEKVLGFVMGAAVDAADVG